MEETPSKVPITQFPRCALHPFQSRGDKNRNELKETEFAPMAEVDIVSLLESEDQQCTAEQAMDISEGQSQAASLISETRR